MPVISLEHYSGRTTAAHLRLVWELEYHLAKRVRLEIQLSSVCSWPVFAAPCSWGGPSSWPPLCHGASPAASHFYTLSLTSFLTQTSDQSRFLFSRGPWSLTSSCVNASWSLWVWTSLMSPFTGLGDWLRDQLVCSYACGGESITSGHRRDSGPDFRQQTLGKALISIWIGMAWFDS